MHFDLLHAVALARFAAAAAHVEREASRRIPAQLRALRLCKEITDIGEQPRIRRRVRARCPSDRALVYADHLVEIILSENRAVLAGPCDRAHEIGSKAAVNNAVHE